jgi:hypothetical protein
MVCISANSTALHCVQLWAKAVALQKTAVALIASGSKYDFFNFLSLVGDGDSWLFLAKRPDFYILD